MPRCRAHIDPTKWMEAAIVNGRARVVCQLCGAFIGYRPPEQERRARQRVLDDEPQQEDHGDAELG